MLNDVKVTKEYIEEFQIRFSLVGSLGKKLIFVAQKDLASLCREESLLIKT